MSGKVLIFLKEILILLLFLKVHLAEYHGNLFCKTFQKLIVGNKSVITSFSVIIPTK